ncbi:hypothetical protein D3C73_977860 [compost metagenome]
MKIIDIDQMIVKSIIALVTVTAHRLEEAPLRHILLHLLEIAGHPYKILLQIGNNGAKKIEIAHRLSVGLLAELILEQRISSLSTADPLKSGLPFADAQQGQTVEHFHHGLACKTSVRYYGEPAVQYNAARLQQVHQVLLNEPDRFLILLGLDVMLYSLFFKAEFLPPARCKKMHCDQRLRC